MPTPPSARSPKPWPRSTDATGSTPASRTAATDRIPVARALAVAALVTGLAYGVLMSHRTDYLGHYLAGMGGTLLLLMVPLGALDRSRWAVAVVVAVAVGIGYVTEATVFKLAIFDPVDFANQSLGAVVAGCGTIDRPRTAAGALGIVVLGAILLAVGFVAAFA